MLILLFCFLCLLSCSGLIYGVVPGVMGIAVYSPPLDRRGNSFRGVEFFKHLMSLERYSFGIFDQLMHTHMKVRLLFFFSTVNICFSLKACLTARLRLQKKISHIQ